MGQFSRTPGSSAHDLAREAIALVMANPRRARAMAQAAIAVPAGGDVTATVTAHRALGLATRELHDAAGGAVHLRRAVSIADRSGVAPLAAEARMSLALVLDDLGRPRAALRAIDLARQTSTGLAFARATMQRAVILRRMGRCPEALADYRVALNTFRRYGDRLWQARALTNRGVLYAYTGEIALAEAD
ncbi:MAG TPA: tetratricopeptide repeat protein, partial [Micromonosporaceae bacterium]|nr:tetratricopeptide repeat protein [Micromonosporaceae bacterium]